MTETTVLPELKEIVGALLFAAREPVTVDGIRKVFKDAAKQFEGPVKDFGKVTADDIEAAIRQLDQDLKEAKVGLHVGEVANGYRLENDMNCGTWIRQMLEKGRSTRLSKPALETLAIIAYRQPCTRSEIEAVRGVAVDSIMKNLIDMQLVKVVGRSELPGKPWLHATTKKFLEYFGLKSIENLPGIEELKRLEQAKAEAADARNEAVEAEEDEEEDGDGNGDGNGDGDDASEEEDEVDEFDDEDDDDDDEDDR